MSLILPAPATDHDIGFASVLCFLSVLAVPTVVIKYWLGPFAKLENPVHDSTWIQEKKGFLYLRIELGQPHFILRAWLRRHRIPIALPPSLNLWFSWGSPRTSEDRNSANWALRLSIIRTRGSCLHLQIGNLDFKCCAQNVFWDAKIPLLAHI